MGPAPMTGRPSMVTSGTRTGGGSGAKLETLTGAHPNDNFISKSACPGEPPACV